MTVALLDANVLIALVVRDHQHHDQVAAWFAGGVEFAICPLVEGALVRFMVRLGEPGSTAQEILRGVHAHDACRRWSDDLSYVDLDLDEVRGHRQVTDSYLAGLAAAHGGTLATLDIALAQRRPSNVFLIPDQGWTALRRDSGIDLTAFRRDLDEAVDQDPYPDDLT